MRIVWTYLSRMCMQSIYTAGLKGEMARRASHFGSCRSEQQPVTASTSGSIDYQYRYRSNPNFRIGCNERQPSRGSDPRIPT